MYLFRLRLLRRRSVELPELLCCTTQRGTTVVPLIVCVTFLWVQAVS